VTAGKVSSKDFSADIVRQLRTLNDAGIEKQVAAAWGVIHNTPARSKSASTSSNGSSRRAARRRT